MATDHSYDSDPIFQSAVAEAFNSGLDMLTTMVAVGFGDGPMPPDASVKFSDLLALSERLHKPVPRVPDKAVAT